MIDPFNVYCCHGYFFFCKVPKYVQVRTTFYRI